MGHFDNSGLDPSLMFNRRTLFIVGAGAGYDIGMPIGTKLAEIVAKKVDIELDEFDRPTNRDGGRILKIATKGDSSKFPL